jgi:hypothetical protein
MLAPEVLHVGLKLGAEGAVVVEAGDTTVDFETWSEEKLLFEQVLTFLTLVLLCKILIS